MRQPSRTIWLALTLALAACQAPATQPPARFALGTLELSGPAVAPAELAAVERRYSLQALDASDGVIVTLRDGVRPPAGARALGGRVWALRAGSSAEARTWLARLGSNPAVEAVEPDVAVRAASWQPNDPLYREQWSLQAIGAPALWAHTRGKEAPLVAIVDSGVDAAHPDLVGRVVKGRDFIDDDDDPADPLGHGTFVAGIVAAAGDNRAGIVGIAPEARVLAVRVLDERGLGRGSSVIEGIRAAARGGAKVINLSLGSFYRSAAMAEAVREVQASGCLVVAAGGNSGDTSPTYPAGYPGVIGVGAIDPQRQRCVWSTRGSTIRIAAPGLDIPSCVAGAWQVESGTSVAAPHVAGVAAALWGLVPRANAEDLDRALTRTGPTVTGFPSSWVRGLDAEAARLALVRRLGPTPAPTATTRPEMFAWSYALATDTTLRADWRTFQVRDARLEVTDVSPHFTSGVRTTSRATLSELHALTVEGLKPATMYWWRVSYLGEDGLRVFGTVGTCTTRAASGAVSPGPAPVQTPRPTPSPTPRPTPTPTPRPTPTPVPSPTPGEVALRLTDVVVLPTSVGLSIGFNTTQSARIALEVSRTAGFERMLRTEARSDAATRHLLLIRDLPLYTPLWIRVTATAGAARVTAPLAGPLTLTP